MKKYLLVSISAVLFWAGCSEELLNPTPYGQLASSNYWTTADAAITAVNGIYEPLRDEDFYGHSEQTFEICGDDFWRAGDHGEDQAIEDFTFDPDNDQLSFSYRFKYEMISRANAVLINVPGINMDGVLKNRLLGEAYFLRGYAHWRLAVIYGDVQLLNEEDVKNANYNKPKSTQAEVLNFVEQDWLKAVEFLPANYTGSNVGRAHQGTALGMLTKLYVYRNELAKAIQTGTRVINGPYPLASNYKDNFTIATENNPEMLFAVQCKDGWAGSDYKIYTTPRPWGGWDFHEPIQDLINEFEVGDPRLKATVFSIGDTVNLGGTRGNQVYAAGFSQTGYHFRKFASWRATGGLTDDQNIPLLRTADVYLLVAEAKIRSNQNGDAEINAVRARVGLQPVTNATMKELIHERRVELAGEAERHQDLMRWDRAGIIDVISHYKIDRGQFKPSRNFQKPKHYFFALPQREIDLSNGVLVQNPNY